MVKLYADKKLTGFSSFVDGVVLVEVREIQLDDEIRRSPEAVAKRLIRNDRFEEGEDILDACIERLRSLGREDKIAEIKSMLFCKRLIPTKEVIRFP